MGVDEKTSTTDPDYIDDLKSAITTRVFAKRLERQSIQGSTNTIFKQPHYSAPSRQSSVNSRQNSKFLVGTSVPNSKIKSDLRVQQEPLKKTKEEEKRERDEHVAKILQRLQPKEYDETQDLKAWEQIKQELQKDSLYARLNLADENKSNKSKSISSDATSYSSSDSVRNPWHHLKEKRRISMRTENLLPIRERKPATYEQIKKAIENSKLGHHLIDVDNLNEIKSAQNHSPVFSLYSFVQMRKDSMESKQMRRSFIKRRNSSLKSSIDRLSGRRSSKLRNLDKVMSKSERMKMPLLKKEEGHNIQTQTSFTENFLDPLSKIENK